MIVIACPDQGAGNDPEALGFSQKRIIVIACPDQGAGNDPETLGLAFYHQGPTFIMHVVKLLKARAATISQALERKWMIE